MIRSTKRGRITNRLHHRRAHILFKRLEQEKGYQHGVVKRIVGRKALERHLFESKILQRPMHQLVTAPAVIARDYRLRIEPVCAIGLQKGVIDGVTHPKVGHQYRIRPGKRQQHLAVLVKRPTENAPAKALPTFALAAEFQVLPYFPAALLVAAPIVAIGWASTHILLDRLVKLAATDVSDPQLLKGRKQLLIEKAAVHANDDGHFRPVVLANFGHQVADHLVDGLSMIAVDVSAAENRIDDKAFPSHLKRLETLDLLVSGLYAVANFCLIVVHDHGIYAQNDHVRRLQAKPPQKQPLQKVPKQIDARPPERTKKTLYCMGRKHAVRFGLCNSRIPCIFGKGIEIAKVSAGAVHEKAEQLLENLADRLALAVASHGSKKGLQLPKYLNVAKVTHEKVQSASAGHVVGGDRKSIDDGLVFCRDCVKFVHVVSHLLGFSCAVYYGFDNLVIPRI